MSARQLAENWTDIAAQLLKIGATAYGGPAIMGVMLSWAAVARGLSSGAGRSEHAITDFDRRRGRRRRASDSPWLKVGAFTFGGGLTMIAFIQEQVVSQWSWLTPQEFIDGLALGQLTPGPVLMVAAYVGYKVAGFAGAVVGSIAAFLPSFVMMLVLLPVFDRARTLKWTRAALRGIAPAVIGVLAVSLVRLAPHAVLDVFTLATLAATVVVLMLWRVNTIKVMLGGAVLGIARSRLLSLPVTRSLLSAVTRS